METELKLAVSRVASAFEQVAPFKGFTKLGISSESESAIISLAATVLSDLESTSENLAPSTLPEFLESLAMALIAIASLGRSVEDSNVLWLILSIPKMNSEKVKTESFLGHTGELLANRIDALIDLIREIRISEHVNRAREFDLRLFYDETADLLVFLGNIQHGIARS